MPITYNSLSLQKSEIPEPNTQFQSLIHRKTRRKGKHALARHTPCATYCVCYGFADIAKGYEVGDDTFEPKKLTMTERPHTDLF